MAARLDRKGAEGTCEEQFPMIYHEKQVGALCGQHCLNNLLGSSAVSLDDLCRVAQELDRAERALLGDGGGSVAQSSNVDESGNFSLSVLQKALVPFEMTLVRVGSDSAGEVIRSLSEWSVSPPLRTRSLTSTSYGRLNQRRGFRG